MRFRDTTAQFESGCFRTSMIVIEVVTSTGFGNTLLYLRINYINATYCSSLTVGNLFWS